MLFLYKIINFLFLLVLLYLIYIYTSNEKFKFRITEQSYGLALSLQDGWSFRDEWLQIHKSIFLRIDTAQYLHDKKELLIFMLAKKNTKYDELEFFTKIYYKNELIAEKILPVEKNEFYHWNNYQDSFVKAKFDLNSILNTEEHNLNNFKIKISIKSQSKSVYNQDDFIEARVKHYREPNKKHQHTIICVEPLFLKAEQFKDFQWWIELAKLSGYTKIAIYNNSIEDSLIYRKLIEENKYFMDIYQFNYLPYLINDAFNGTYVKHMNDLVKGGYDGVYWNFYQVYFLAIDAMAYHDCLFKYSNDYKYVIIQDTDELVIPNRLKPFKSYDDIIKAFERNKREDLCEQKLDASILDDYLSSLYPKYSIPSNQSLYFQSVYYMNPITVKELINMLVEYLGDSNSRPKYPVSLKFVDPIHKSFTYFYTINDANEHDYVIEIVKIYKQVIEPFLDKHEMAISKTLYNFNEIFYMTRKLIIDVSFGKTFANPDTASITNPHFPKDNYFKLNEEDNHFLSHFRHRNNKLKNTNASVTSIRIDLNYFICYYIPIFEKLSNIEKY